MSAPLCFVDTETDGVHPGRRVWEIAIIRRDERRQHEQTFFVDIDLSTADPFGLRVGRFYERHPRGRHLAGADSAYPVPGDVGDYRTSWSAALTVARLTHGAHLVGAVPNFDAEVFAALLREKGLTPAWHYHLIDVESLAVGHLAAQGRPVPPPWKSADVTEALGVPTPPEHERHTALGDARWAMATYDAVMGAAATTTDPTTTAAPAAETGA